MAREIPRGLVEALFRPPARPAGLTSIGAELELIPVRADDGRRVGIMDTSAGVGTATVIAEAAGRGRWRSRPLLYGAPAWELGYGGTLAYEPGGQLEIGSPVFDTPDALAGFLAETVTLLREHAAAHGITLLLTGVDPANAVEDVPLELHAERYARMTRYFDAIGPAGARMMRQTASLQVSVELGEDPLGRWRLLNTLAPYLLALAANSSQYAGQDTGHASYRAHLWRTLDPSRTGMIWSATDPIGTYARFADQAGRILDDDAAHLTTLFPEVRPRSYFELRSIDAVEPERMRPILMLIHRVAYDPEAATGAVSLLGPPDPDLLIRAGERGLTDARIAEGVRALEGLTGVSVLGAGTASTE